MTSFVSIFVALAIGAEPAAPMAQPEPKDAEVFTINEKMLSIPIRCDPAQKSTIKELHLFVSTDQGKTWNKVATASPDEELFQFSAPRDGLYWFSLQIVDKKNNKIPPDVHKLPAMQKVMIDTSGKAAITANKPPPEAERRQALEAEVVSLRGRVQQLEQRLAAVESILVRETTIRQLATHKQYQKLGKSVPYSIPSVNQLCQELQSLCQRFQSVGVVRNEVWDKAWRETLRLVDLARKVSLRP